MGKTSKNRELKLANALTAAVDSGATAVESLRNLEAALFKALAGVPCKTVKQERVNAHRVYFAWDGVRVYALKATDLPTPKEAEVKAALRALAEDASPGL